MGTLIGHVAPGFAFFALGLWHFFNHIKLHLLHPKSYKSSPWFPTSKVRYLEPILIMVASLMSISMELFIGPHNHQPFDHGFIIPSNHLHNFEHSLISLTFFVYASFAIIFDKTKNLNPKIQFGLTQLFGGVAFGQQLFIFHLHSTDHMGVEGQYHFLLQIIILVSMTTTLMSIRYHASFIVSFLRSISIMFQGVWLIIMGYMVWTPYLVAEGCFIHLEMGHEVLRCSSEEALHRAKSLVNIEFSLALVVMMIFASVFYLGLNRIYGGKIHYSSLTDTNKYTKEEEMSGYGYCVDDNNDFVDDVVALKENKLGESSSFIHMGKGFAPVNMER